MGDRYLLKTFKNYLVMKINKSVVLLLLFIFQHSLIFSQLQPVILSDNYWFNSQSACIDKNDAVSILYAGSSSGLHLFSSGNGCFSRETLNDSTNIKETAITADMEGNLHIVFSVVDISQWPYVSRLYYQNNKGGSWSVPKRISWSDAGMAFMHIFCDTLGYLHVGYATGGVARFGRLVYITNKSGNWVYYEPNDEIQVYDNMAMALDRGGHVHFAFYGFTNELGPGYLSNAPGHGFSNPEEIHPDWRGGQMENSYISIAIDTLGYVHIAYSGDTKTDPPQAYFQNPLYATDKSGSWENTKLDEGASAAGGCHILIDSLNRPQVCYGDKPDDVVRLAVKTGNDWSYQTVHSPMDPGKIIHLLKSNGDDIYLLGDWTSLTLITGGITSGATIDPASLSFGKTDVYSDTTAQITLKNTGVLPLTICGAKIFGRDAIDFSASSPSGVLSQGDSVVINVTFRPLSGGQKSAGLSISCSDIELTADLISLSGEGLPVYTQWAYAFGGPYFDFGRSAHPVSDGGYLVTGSINPTGDSNSNYGWIMKLDFAGNLEWSYEYDNEELRGDINDACEIIIDGKLVGYAFTGYIFYPMRKDVIIGRIDLDGNPVWSKTIGGDWIDVGHCVSMSYDQQLIFGGMCGSPSLGATDHDSPWIIKTDLDGQIQWQQIYTGGNHIPELPQDRFIIRPSIDSGLVVLGVHSTWNDPDQNIWVDRDGWLLKLDSNGEIEWQTRFGVTKNEYFDVPNSITELIGVDNTCSGYMITGRFPTARGNVGSYFGIPWGKGKTSLYKFSPSGNLEWLKLYNEGEYSLARAVKQIDSSTVVVAGITYNPEEDYQGIFLMGLDLDGDIAWKSHYDGFKSLDKSPVETIDLCTDKGFILSGSTSAYGAGMTDLLVIKTDSLGHIPGCNLMSEPVLTVENYPDADKLVTSTSKYMLVTNALSQDVSLSVHQFTPVITLACSYAPPIDTDEDGIDDDEESGPDKDDPSYDGNTDGTPDRSQNNVCSFHTATGEYITLASPEGTKLVGVGPQPNPDPVFGPEGTEFYYDFFSFMVTGLEPGGSADVMLYLPSDARPGSYFKYGLQEGPVESMWYEFMYNDTTGAEINDNIITLHFTDGLRGDDDIEENGIIFDIGAPAWIMAPEMLMSRDTIMFDSILIGTDQSRTLIIDNGGELDLVIDSLKLAGPDSLSYEVTELLNEVISPQENINIPVRFIPSETGVKIGYLRFYTNDYDTVVVLKGFGKDQTTSIEEQRAVNREVLLYPNPSEGRVFVVLPEEFINSGYRMITVRNILGEKVISGNYMPEQTLDIKDLPAGIYFISVDINGYHFSGKLIRK
jgi:hypothetical protein